jgi:hypothetical protein
MKTISFCLFVLFVCAASFARTVDLFYTEDGKNTKIIRGFFINDNFTLAPEGDESWLLIGGQKIGPNGYTPKESKLQFGGFGKTYSLFQVMTDDFLGYGHNKRLDRTLNINDIAYILPDPTAYEPLHVFLNDGIEGQLFVAGDYTESTGARVIQGKPSNDISIIWLKYDISRNQRGPDTRPKQFGLKAKAVSFSETGLRRAMRFLADTPGDNQ